MAPCSRVSRLRSVVSRAAQNKKRVMAVRQRASTGSTGDRRRRATLAHSTFHILTKTSATVHRRMKVDPGGAIFIHGLPTDYGPFDPPRWYRDWTEGCISVGNAAVVKIWEIVPDGTPIEILHEVPLDRDGDRQPCLASWLAAAECTRT